MAEDTGDVPDDAAIRRQADRIVSSDEFSRSARGRELLRYVVDEALAGRGDALSATTIAQDVLGKGADFDSGSDPLVRVQMGRMRSLLAGWYDAHADEAAVRITVPKGAYKPRFEAASARPGTGRAAPAPPRPEAAARPPAPASPPSPPRERFWLRPGHAVSLGLAACVLAAVLLAAVLGGPDAPPRYPVVLVGPFENLTGDARNDELRTGLQRQLASDLQRFRTVRVAVDDTQGPAVGQPGRMAVARAAPPPADYAVSGAILAASDGLDFTVELTDLRDGSLVERRRLRGEVDGNYYDLLAELSQSVTGRIVGGGGAVEQAEAARAASRVGLPDAQELTAFRCLIAFEDFTRLKTPEGARRTHDCLTGALERRPDDSTLLAALAWTRAMVAPEAGQVDAGPWARGYTLAGALRLAERAVAAGPGDDFAHEHLGLLQWRTGETTAAVGSLRRAAALNPGNPNLLADLALYLGLTGSWDEALETAETAFERSGDPPGWYALPRYYRAVLDGDGDEAVRLARIVAPGDPFGPAYELVAAQVAGDEDRVEALRPLVLGAARRSGGDPLAHARPWIRSDEVLDALSARLAEAGVRVDES